MSKIENVSFSGSKIGIEKIILNLKKKNKSLPTKLLYDDEGSKLFEKICSTEEYYLTRTEKKILELNSSEIFHNSGYEEILELGSGSSKKSKPF